ncbi:MAG: leucine-rich repeat protein [Prevotella sp.]|nr:leucine-rich repeat protein [Prevotella sp.]
MKKLLFLLILILLPMLASATTVSDVKNSGCLNKTLEEKKQPYPTIVLTKEGSVLSVQLLNYETYDATTDFNVTSSISGDTPYSVTINVTPVIPEGAEVYREWVCLFNVSFTVHDLEPNRFYLDCWWFKGLVELTEGEPMVLEYKVENVTIDDMSFRLLKVMHKAMLMNWTTTEEELQIPSEVNYEGEVYTVTSISKDAFWNVNNAAKATIPKTVTSMDLDYYGAIYANPFRECKSLEWIEVEDGCPLFSSKDGVLFAEDKTMLLGYPIAAPSITYTVPEGVTKIRSGAFHHNMYLRKLVIPEGVTNLGWHLFNDTKSLEELYIKGVLEPECMRDLFGGMDTKVTVYVQSSEVEKFQAVYKGPVYPLPESGTDDSDYFPFVELGKQWNVVSTVASPSSSCHFEKYVISEAVERDGKTYFRVWQSEDDLTVVHDAGLYREENRRVYKYDETAGRDIMLYDFSLKEGDTFTYEMGIDNPVNCKVLKQGLLDDGPFVVSSYNSTDTLSRYRHLRTWTIGGENGLGEYDENATWVECVGALENMFNPFATGKRTRLAYIDYSSDKGGENAYLPFSFCNIYDAHGQVHGNDMPTGAADNVEIDDWHHHLTYELEGDRLHVYGKVFCSCGVNHYAYFYEEPTDDPMVRKIRFEIQNANTAYALACQAHHPTNFYVPGFDPNLNYIVVDNQGKEHPVINKTPQNDYRPFIEEGKVWKVGGDGPRDPVQLVEYYYFDGDTIIGGKTCKQMMRQRYVNPDHPDYAIISQYSMQSYVGAWYEEDKKVYLCNTTDQQFKLMYDFSVNADDTLQINNLSYAIGPKQTGGLKGFKGVYRDVRLYGMYNTTWLEGVGNIDGPIYSVYLGKEGHALFLMSCTVGDEVIYLNDEYEDGATPAGARKRFDFTHTIKTKPKSRMRSGENQSLHGEYNDLQLGINLNPLDDAYLVRITDDAGKVIYEKPVNAGNIVGLNIDISAYAKGHYTITMENSQEIFTGEFEAQATGIEEIRNKKSEGRSIIYNLQGQRLSTLQRGLNIINGQKVFVR